MIGAVKRMIRSQGLEYQVLNGPSGGGRSVPEYDVDGTLVGVLERRSAAGVRTVIDSAGTEVESDLEIRAILDGPDVDVHPAGSADDAPTKLVHPNGTTYLVLDVHEEDHGVAALTVVIE